LFSLLGYFALVIWGHSASEQQLMFWVGILLLVSAGSFLYVATIHIFPEVFGSPDAGHQHHLSGEVRKKSVEMSLLAEQQEEYERELKKLVHQNRYPRVVELSALIFGFFTPLLLMFLNM